MQCFEKRSEVVTGESIELSAVTHDSGAELAFSESADFIERHVFNHVSKAAAAGSFVAGANLIPNQTRDNWQ